MHVTGSNRIHSSNKMTMWQSASSFAQQKHLVSFSGKLQLSKAQQFQYMSAPWLSVPQYQHYLMLFAGQTMITTPVILHVKTAQHIVHKSAQHGHSMKPGAARPPALLPDV